VRKYKLENNSDGVGEPGRTIVKNQLKFLMSLFKPANVVYK